MSSEFGNKLKISIFGQSHSQAVGVVIDGLPAGIKLDTEKIARFMERRVPGRNKTSTARQETDAVSFVSGLYNGFTCGAPLCAMIENNDTRPQDYLKTADIPRPSHADFTSDIKYGGFQDIRGGGHFSGRLTAPLCIAGAVCMQLLEEKGIKIKAHIYSIKGIMDAPFDYIKTWTKEFEELKTGDFPVMDKTQGLKMQELIEAAKEAGDSVGGIIECAVTGFPAGLGDPMFDGIENRISSVILGIPAVKGIAFGNGFEAAELYGSENNDEFYAESGEIKTRTNNHGGILGGISSGMPIIFKVAIKPTPSIAKPQKSVSLSRKTDATLAIEGRHDPCIVPRAVPCVEAAAAIALTDYLI